ncbi:hypothetical protein Tco_1179063 [Tanacetum coccineum]
MIKLRDLGANTPTGVPYTEEQILALVIKGKQRDHIPGRGRQVVRRGKTSIFGPHPRGTYSSTEIDDMLAERDHQLLSQLGSQSKIGSVSGAGGGSGSGGGADDHDGEDDDEGHYSGFGRLKTAAVCRLLRATTAVLGGDDMSPGKVFPRLVLFNLVNTFPDVRETFLHS